ncbi:MerR family transcriptional regulator [Paenibacillus sp. 1P07SE]|uniref:MerR family transcriptional regulator n=1 Tax=Paenibacillus sp. 1P07SE TaxID=3132209 RepID=UPI0039A46F14
MRANGYRRYSERDLIRLQQILLLKSLGYRLESIRELLAGETSSGEDETAVWVASLKQQIVWIENMQRELTRKRVLLQSVIHAIGTSGKLHAAEILGLLGQLEHREVEGEVIPASFDEKGFTPEEQRILSSLPVMGSADPRVEDYIRLLGGIRTLMDNKASPGAAEAQAMAEQLYRWALSIFEGNEILLSKYWHLLAPGDSGKSPVYGHDQALMDYIGQMMDVLLSAKGDSANDQS